MLRSSGKVPKALGYLDISEGAQGNAQILGLLRQPQRPWGPRATQGAQGNAYILETIKIP